MADFKINDRRRFTLENQSSVILDAYGSNIEYIGPKENPEVIEKAVTGPNRDYSQYGEWALGSQASQIGRLSFYLLRHLYRSSAVIRPCVDGIAKAIANLDWQIINKDMKYHPPEEVQDIADFLMVPNSDKETFSVLIEKVLLDILVIGKFVIEKVRNGNKEIVELVARDAALFQPVIDKKTGHLLYYREYSAITHQAVKEHDPNDFIFRYFNPTTYSLDGLPIIETIINETATLLLATKAIGWIFVNDEIPPGILHLGQIGDIALARAKASFEAQRGVQSQTKMRVVDNVDEVEWVPFDRPFREMQVAELMPHVIKIVAANFGLNLVELGMSDLSRFPSGLISSDFTRSKLVPPLMKLLKDSLNVEVINEADRDVLFIWVQQPSETFEQQAAGHQSLWRSALETRNEARLKLGLPPVEGGDQFTVLLGNEVVPLNDKGIPLYRNPPTIPPSSNKPEDVSRRPTIGNPEEPNTEAGLPVTEEDFRSVFGLPAPSNAPLLKRGPRRGSSY